MKNIILDTDFLVVATSIITALSVLVSTLMFFIKKKSEKTADERYDFERKLIEIDYLRKHLENQLNDASRKLESTQEMWNDINHLIISSQNKISNNSNNKPSDINILHNSFFTNTGITPTDTIIDNKLVFYLTPFNGNFISTYETVKKVCNSVDLLCSRGDEEFIEGDIFPHILKMIVKARVIVANITSRNPNVLYELGIAHALNKPTIIIAENLTEAPFDVQAKQLLIYNSQSDLADKLKTQLLKMVLRDK